jgi:LAO/AO transport system kinase
MKAGLMEIGDVFVLNKSDREGSDRAAKDVQSALGLRPSSPSSWRPPVVRAVASEGRGVDELLEAIGRFREHQSQSGEGRERRRRVLREKIREATERILRQRLWRDAGGRELDEAAKIALEDHGNPYELAAQLASRLAANGRLNPASEEGSR